MHILSFIVSMGFYMLFLFLFLEYTREKQRFYKWFFIFTLLSFPLWFINLDSFFRWAKTVSVLIPICFVSFVRISNDGKHPNFLPSLKKTWPLWLFYGIVALNIAEATFTDIQMGNLFNALCGIILIICMPTPTKNRWYMAKHDGKHNFGELIAELPIAWCLLYVSWNACFVYAENTTFFASSLCILLIIQVWMLVKKRSDLWLMGRIYTLAIHIFIRASYDIFTPIMNSSAWFNETVLNIWGIVNLSLHVLYLAYWFMKYRNKEVIMKYSARAYGF